MTNLTKRIVVSVALLALVICAAYLAHDFIAAHGRAALLAFHLGLSGLAFGAVTVTYQFPIAGTTAPTPALAAAAGFHNGYNTVRGTVIAAADADTTATLTHTFGLSTAALAAGQPEVQLIPRHAAYYTSVWLATYTDGNTVTLTKGTGAGSGTAGVQLGFILRRPHSIAI